ncbi:hypothetical protein FGO68_gene11374 [Halteria grandinella]|uniref:Glycosyltransferase family 8 protein n=1 Tax=Halteria grandinella TaxID=5974 RepID=A0A8J8NZZ6_HALGN|nr:hypothetical protein FGO68_gene11374 [Halteria grandinella]
MEAAAVDKSQVKKVYATMITDDKYISGLQVMHYTLRKFTQRTLVIILQDNVKKITEKQLEKLSNVIIKKVSHLSNPHEKNASDASWIGSGYTKLYIWSLVEYEQLFYIDADCMINACIEDVFDRDVSFAAAPDVFPPDHFNAGVLLIKPSIEIFNDMVAKSPDMPSYDGGDTGFLNNYFPDWYKMESQCRLPYGYNAQRILHWFTIKRTDGYWKEVEKDGGLKIIHYSSSPKPWEGKPKGDLEAIWYGQFIEFLQNK